MEQDEKKVISGYRDIIDGIDDELLMLFIKRMNTAALIAEAKKENNIPVTDISRERSKLAQISDMAPEELREYAVLLYKAIFELSKSYQRRLTGFGNETVQAIKKAIDETSPLFPSGVSVACQGIEGANSQVACDKLIRNANIMYFSDFGAVFSAVEKGLCSYGVVPVENSTAGSVNAVYDMMLDHKFYIVRSIRIKVDHNLLVKPGTPLDEIKEIYSHEQAILQCSEFLQSLKGIKVIPCENTAVAARMVSESGRNDIAALSSRSCARLYNLECLKETVQNKGNNYTRFICISRKLEIYPGADRTSLVVTLPHEQGALFKLMSRFNALGINLNKLESRPIPDRDFEFRFYFDLDVPVYSPSLLQLMGEIGGVCEKSIYLGSYSEMI